MELEKINAKIQGYVGHLQGVDTKVLGVSGFWIWKPANTSIWRIQHALSDNELGRIVVKDGKAMVTPGTFTNPLPQEVRNLPERETFCEDIVGIGYLRQTYLTEKLVEHQVAAEVRRLPDDKSIEQFTPEIVYKGLYSKATSRVFPEGTKLVLVKCKVVETGETIEIRIPASEAATLGLPEFKG
jgi:hypothetical protein